MNNAEAARETSSRTAPTSAGGSPDGVATDKVIGAYRNDKHEYWWNGTGPVPSVTTILGIVDKPAVGIFKAKEAARAIYRKASEDLSSLANEDEAIKWALKEADKARDTAADLGSSVHLLAELVGASESDSTGFEVGSDTFPYIEAYRRFLDRYGASNIVSSEHMVWSLNGYAGTYDFLMMLPRSEVDHRHDGSIPPGECTICKASSELWLIDIKTSGKGPYPEWGLQLAGYRWSDSIIIPGDPRSYPMPEIARTGVLHLRPDLYPDTGWRLIEYPTSYEKDYIAFLAALELWKWRKEGRFRKSNLDIRKP